MAVLISSLADPAAAREAVVKTQPPKPAFRATPLSQRFDTFPGRSIPFEFTVEALLRDVEMKVGSVELKQETTGLILADDSTQSAEGVTLLGAQTFRVRKGQKQTIRGRWTPSPTDGGYATVGVTLTEQHSATGPAPEFRAAASGASIRFVTRYLLRLEANVRGARGGDARPPEIVKGGLASHDGRAIATLLLNAGPEQAGVWTATACIRSLRGPIGRPFPLRLPTRVNMPSPEGERLPLLGGGQVLVGAPVPEPLFEGDYQMEVAVARNGVPTSTKSIPFRVEPGQFPAQRTVIAQVVRDLTVSPTQVELSLARGGARMAPLVLTNRSDQSVNITLQAETIGDESAEPEWLVVRPTRLAIRPYAERRVMVAVRGGRQTADACYANLVLEVAPTETTVGGSRPVLVGLLASERTTPDWEVVGGPRWTTQGAAGFLEITLDNRSDTHLAPEAELRLTDTLGRTIESEGGHGEWVLPGEEGVLRFPFPSLPPGDYGVEASVRAIPGADPVAVQDVLRVE